jgi:UDP-2-acetamido-2-deoxy-ribo-hexuluronate aminotransferase
MQFIDLKQQYQSYKKEIDAAIQKVLDHGKYIMGPEVALLEEKLAEFVGVKHCVGVASGTDALQVSLMALDIGPGDEVITVPWTWISTAEAVKLVGATPVFVDVDKDSFLMDADLLEKAITSKTKAIMPVSLLGQVPNLEKINEIANKYNLPVIEDAAQSLGATHNGRQSCSMTTLATTSFFPAKPFGCYGDGGAIFTNDSDLYEKMCCLRVHGGKRGSFDYPYVGMNARLDTIQAAVLLAKLPHFNKELEARTRVGNYYNELLKEVSQIPTPEEGNTHTYAQYTIKVSQEIRDACVKKLKEEQIPVAIYYPKCLHQLPPYFQPEGSFPVAEQGVREVLSLPMHPWLTQEEQQRIVQVVESTIKELQLVNV